MDQKSSIRIHRSEFTRAASHKSMHRKLFSIPTLFAFLPVLCSAAILPETIGKWQRGEPAAAPVPDQKVWAEYGLQDSELSPYTDGTQKYSIAAYRFSDATGAMAAWDAIRPADSKPIGLMGLSAQTDTDAYVAAGNYLFVFKDYKIRPDELSHVVATVPRYGHSPLPTLPKYLPAGAQPGSERYITGPAGLALYAPSIPPGTAAFSYSAEGELAKFGALDKEITLLMFSYPTMEMARKQYPEFQKIPGAVVKRSGPLVAIALNPASADDAERLLAQIKYQAEVTLPQHVPTPKDNPINLFLNIFILCGVLALFCLASGLVVGGIRVLIRRSGGAGEGEQMISLHLSGKP
jgi:hypothetical protein